MVDQPLPSKDLQNDALRGSSTAGGHPRRSGAGETNAGRRERSRAGVDRRGRYGGRDRGTERTRRLERERETRRAESANLASHGDRGRASARGGGPTDESKVPAGAHRLRLTRRPDAQRR